MSKNRLDRIIQLLIPFLLIILLTVSIFELFFDVPQYSFFIDLLDLFIITIFMIDLYFRWIETPHLIPYVKKHFWEIIATIPFNLMFLGMDYFVFARGLKAVGFLQRLPRFIRYARFIKLIRFTIRLPRFLRVGKIFKKTIIRKIQPHEKEMKGILSFKVILLITINSIMGTGIFFLTASGAKHAGPASLISWFILSIISIYIAMCFSELVSMFPKAGGIYEFAKQTYGRTISFIIGWTTAIAGSVTISMLLLGALQYILPAEYSKFYIPIAIGLVIIFNFIAYKGMQTSKYILVTFSLITLGTVLAVIIPGFFTLKAENLTPFFVFPTMNIILAIFFIAETFFGWESAIFLSAETKNPRKNMPKALIYGTIVIAILSLSLALIGMGVIPWQEYAQSSAPLRDLGAAHFGQLGESIFTIFVFISIIGAVACWIVTAPRLLMAIAEDKLFFVQFAKIHPKYKSPYVSIIFQTIVVSILVIIASGSYETLLHLLIPLILVIYSSVLLSVVILRFKKPNLPRAFKTPFGKIGPLLTIGFMGFLLYMFIQETHSAMEILRISMFLLCIGIPVYFFIELFYEKKYVNIRKTALAKLARHLKWITFPNWLFNRITRSIGPITNKSVILDYNCGVGDFSRKIIKKNMPFKKIYAIEQSKEEIKVFKENIPKELNKKVDIIYRNSWTIPKKVRKVNIFFSFNSLGHINDIPIFIKDMKKVLSKKGKFFFHVYHSLVNITPNALVVEDEKEIKRLFKKQGLKVEYIKKKRIFYQHMFIYGQKK